MVCFHALSASIIVPVTVNLNSCREVMASFRISVVGHAYFAIEAGRRFGVRIVSSPTCSLFTVPRRWA